MSSNVEFFALNQQCDIATRLSEHFDKSLHIPKVVRFADSEMVICLDKDFTLEGKSAVVIHSTVAPVNDNYMQLFFLIDLLKQRGAEKIHVITPYFGYSRQCEGANVAAKMAAKMLQVSGAYSVAAVEIHDKLLKNFFSVSFADITLHTVIAEHIKSRFSDVDDCCLVAPDRGAKQRVEAIADLLQVPSFFFSKKRSGINKIEIVGMHGQSCAGKTAIMIDDIIDTGSTCIAVADILMQQGVEKVCGYFIHPVLSKDAAKKLDKSVFERIFFTNSIDVPESKKTDKMEIVDISEVLINYVKEL